MNNYQHFVILVLHDSFFFEHCKVNPKVQIILPFKINSVCISNTESFYKL